MSSHNRREFLKHLLGLAIAPSAVGAIATGERSAAQEPAFAVPDQESIAGTVMFGNHEAKFDSGEISPLVRQSRPTPESLIPVLGPTTEVLISTVKLSNVQWLSFQAVYDTMWRFGSSSWSGPRHRCALYADTVGHLDGVRLMSAGELAAMLGPRAVPRLTLVCSQFTLDLADAEISDYRGFDVGASRCDEIVLSGQVVQMLNHAAERSVRPKFEL
jgi:hypothetical protein